MKNGLFSSILFSGIRRATTGGLLLSCLIWLAGCDQQPTAKSAPPPPQVGFIVVHPEPVSRTIELPGRTTAVMTADVRPQVNGIILSRLFTEGSEVAKGQQLYQIDPATYQATYDSAVATLARNQAALMTANAKAARYKSLAALKAVSSQDYDDSVAAAKEAEADIATARASIEQAKINLDYTKVLAPISGRIGRSTVTPGALVTANQTSALATVTQLDPIYVDVNQPVTMLLRLRKETATGEIEANGVGAAKVTLKLEDGSTYPIAGKLQFAEVTVDEGTGTVLLRAEFPNPQHLLLPGMYVHGELQEGINRNGILVPQQAVTRNTHGDALVMTLGDGNKVVPRIVQAGQAFGDRWIVTAGLKDGERIIMDGLQNIRPNMVVQPVEESASAAADGKL
ncbi:MAG: efflux RND transporter periplasmic adaptor subunit [Methylovirgula sp.]